MAKYIAPRALGSKSDTSWKRKLYTISHETDGDYDSIYEGEFKGNKFQVDISSGQHTSSDTLDQVLSNLQVTGALHDDEKYELAVALLNHHLAQIARYERESGCDY